MLGAHDVVGAAIGLAGDDRHLGHGRLGIGEEQLRTVFDDAVVFLCGAGKEAWHIDEGHDGDVEAIAKAHEARALDGACDVEAAGEHQRLVCDYANRPTIHPSEASYDVGGVVGLQDRKSTRLNSSHVKISYA